jgi:hypothetical protein
LKFITKIKSLPESDVEEYENSILYILKICKEIKARIPNSMFHIIGISIMNTIPQWTNEIFTQ